MRRALVALSFGLVVALAASRAVAYDFKWNPKVKKPAPTVGEKVSQDAVESHKFSNKVSAGEKTVQSMKERRTVTYKLTREVIAVDGKKATERLYKIETWKQESKDEEPDTSLGGHTVRVKGNGSDKTYAIEDDPKSQVSEAAKKWIESEIAKKKPKKKKSEEKATEDDDDEDEEFIHLIFPKEPVADGAKWTPDVAAIAKALKMEAGPEKAAASGSITNVRVEDGVHVGHLEIKVSLATKIPNVTWKEGGNMELAFTIDTSLEPDKRNASSASMEMNFSGTGD